jgi:hypothetical protein
MTETHIIQDISFDQENMFIIVDGKSIQVAMENISSKLKAANDFQRQFFKVSPSGYGIHWPLIDEDLSIDAILKTAIDDFSMSQ